MPPRKEPSMEETMSAMVEAISKLTDKINSDQSDSKALLDIIVKQLAAQYDQTTTLLSSITNLGSTSRNTPPPPPPPPPTPPLPPPNGLQNPRPPKILLPTFNGTNPLDWIFQADNYFTYYSIPPNQRLALSVFYFTGDALSWYKHLAQNQLLGTWPDFVRALELRFGPSTYENHQAALFKLQQTSTVTAYQTEFEHLSNRVTGLSHDTLKNCFISGLRADIQSEIAVHHPQTLHDTYGLAKVIEDKINASNYPSSVVQQPTSPSSGQSLLEASPLPSTPLPIKRLSPTEMQKRRADGLCYNCPEKYHRGHQCNPPKFLLLQSTNDTEVEITDPPWGLFVNDFDKRGLEDKADFQGGRN